MQRKITYTIMASLFALMLITSSAEAFAMSGTVKFGGTGLSASKVTIENNATPNGNYATVTTGAGGTWSYTPPTGSYTVSAMKSGFTHVAQTGITQGQTGLIHNVNSRTSVTAEFKIVGDEEFRNTYGAGWKTTAKSKLLTAEPWFKTEHSITFADVAYYDTWDSTDNPTGTCLGGTSLLPEVKSETGWSGGTYSGAQILAAFSNQQIESNPFVIGCGDKPLTGGTHPGFIVTDCPSCDISQRIMHEITHNYGFPHTLTCTNTVPAIMNTDSMNNACSNQINNWNPTDDTTIESSRRTWY